MKISASAVILLTYFSRCKAYFPFMEPAPLKCYECSQAPQHRCINVIDISKNTCPKIAEDKEPHEVRNVCIKTVTINRNVNNSVPAINRKCGTTGPGKYDTCSELMRQASDLTCYSCGTNLCNGSNTILFNISLFSVAVACACLLRIFM